MAPLTWRNVNAPDLSAAGDMMHRATQGIVGAFKGAGDIARSVSDMKTETGTKMALAEAAKITDSEGWASAMQNGSAFGGIDPGYISTQALQWGAERGSSLLRDDQTRQAMELARNAEARAAEAHAMRMSLGAGAGSGAGRRGGSSGGGRQGSRDANNMAVARAEAAHRMAVAEFGTDSPQALEAAQNLIAVSGSLNNVTGFLNGVDDIAGVLTSRRETADREFEADVAATLSSRFDDDGRPLPVPFNLSTAIADNYQPAVELAPAPTPSAPLSFDSSEGETPVPAPAAGQSRMTLSMGREVDAQGRATGEERTVQVNAPTAIAEGTIRPEKRPALSWGEDVPAMPSLRAEDAPALSWSEAIAQAPQPEAEQPSGPNPADYGLPDYFRGRREFNDFIAAEQAYQEQTTRAEEARNSDFRPTTVDPDMAARNISTVDRTIARAVRETPQFMMDSQVAALSQAVTENGPMAVATAVRTQLGMPGDDAEVLETVREVAEKHGVTEEIAGAAMIAARDYASSGWISSAQYFNEDRVADLIKQREAIDSDPTAARGYDELSRIRSTQNQLNAAYNNAARLHAEAAIRAEMRPNNREYQETLRQRERDLLAIQGELAQQAFSISERLSSIGANPNTTGGPRQGERPAPRLEDYIPASLRAELEENMRTYGTPEGRGQLFSSVAVDPAVVAGERRHSSGRPMGPETPHSSGRNADLARVNANPEQYVQVFNPGQIDPGSEGGQRIAEQYLPIMTAPTQTDGNRETFFNWVLSSPETSRDIFSRIQAAEYESGSLDAILPDNAMAAYEEFRQRNVPAQAVQDLTALGFDLSDRPQVALSVLNDPEAQRLLRRWQETDTFWRAESTKRFNRQAAQRRIREILGAQTEDES